MFTYYFAGPICLNVFLFEFLEIYVFEKTGRRAFSKNESNIQKFKMEHTYNYCRQLHIFEVFDVSYYGEYLAFHTDTIVTLYHALEASKKNTLKVLHKTKIIDWIYKQKHRYKFNVLVNAQFGRGLTAIATLKVSILRLNLEERFF